MEGGEGEDSEWRRDAYCAPRNSLLCLTAEFYNKCSAKLHEINKRKDQEKQLELLDTRYLGSPGFSLKHLSAE